MGNWIRARTGDQMLANVLTLPKVGESCPVRSEKQLVKAPLSFFCGSSHVEGSERL